MESLHTWKQNHTWSRQPQLDEEILESGKRIGLQVSVLLGPGILPWEVWRLGEKGRPVFVQNGSRLFVWDVHAWEHLESQLKIGVYGTSPVD